MLLTHRRKISDEIEEWFHKIEQDTGIKLTRSVFDVVTAMHTLGYFLDPEYPYCKKCVEYHSKICCLCYKKINDGELHKKINIKNKCGIAHMKCIVKKEKEINENVEIKRIL